MALKAGYVGVKRWLYEKLGTTVKSNSDQLTGISNFSGAKNLLAFPYAQDSWSTAQGLSATANADGSITLSGTLSAPSSILLHGRSGQTDRNAFTLPAGTYIASKNIVPGVILELNILKSGSKFVIADVGANTEQVTFTLEEAAQVGAQLITATGVTTISGTVKPMIRLASDPDATYAPYAKTNQQLTTETEVLKKTAVTVTAPEGITVNSNTHVHKCAHIVTGCIRLEFASVPAAGSKIAHLSVAPYNSVYQIAVENAGGKTMPVIVETATGDIKLFGAYQPTSGNQLIIQLAFCEQDAALSRSIDTIPEVIEDDPEPVTKTTKSSTKKTTTTKEGE